MSAFAQPIREYPVQGLMPKQDTQAEAFIKKHPEYDGRGVVIAILDTGVDPGAAGMQVTTDGKPKVIDIVDCTGGGDVQTTTIVTPSEHTVDGQTVRVIQGLSGRELILDSAWQCPSGEFHVGIKRAYELYPSELVSRLKSERRQQHEVKQASLLSQAQADLAKFNQVNPSTQDKKLIAAREDLEARIASLKALLKSYEDPGMILDCVVFHDGQNWRAVVDVTETGDLRGQPALTDYRKELKYHTFGKADLLNFSVNIYEEGNLLSIVTLSGSHGTHVAGITAANFPDDPALNGVAPGAQIISLRIGDARLGSMETGPGLTRAASYLSAHQVDLANMSYGESSSLPSDGHFIRLLANEAIAKAGCTFVTSAGNDGPCFSSIGAPAGMDTGFITVGAFVKHTQMEAEYAMLESVAEQPYTWSSRGPCTDGYRGVDIYAPGSAITSVPVYGLNKLDLKNGTSMSSPNACGCIALLISALKAQKQEFTPYRLKNAVVQSAKSVNDPLNVGFIQVEKAWEYLETYRDRKDLDMLFDVTVLKGGEQRGVYLREYDESRQVQYLTVKVQPQFMGEKDLANPKYNWAKFEYDARVAMVATESWISAPDFLYLHSGGNAFQIKVDPTSLSEGEFHYGEVLGYDTAAPDRGPIFRIPVSVVKPSVPHNGSLSFPNQEFSPGTINRRFIHVPYGAGYAELTLRARAPISTNPARFMLHLLQFIPKKSQKDKRAYSFMLGSGSYGDPKSEEQVITKRFAVRGGLTLEVCLAQFWSGLGKHLIDMNIEFHGVQLAGNATSGQSVVNFEPQLTRLDIVSPFRKEDKVDVSVNFKKLRKYLRPTEAKISPLHPDRNTLPDTRVLYALVLKYTYKAEASTTIVPLFPTVMDQLYEHYLAGVFGIVFDAHRKVVGYLDVFKHNIELPTKGTYTIALQLTSEEENVLEKLKTTICQVDTDIKSTAFNAYKTIGDVYRSDRSNYAKISLERGEAKALFIAAPTGDQPLPKEAKPGDALVGSLTFTNASVDGGQYVAQYIVPVESKSSSNGAGDSKNEKPTDDDKINRQLSDALRDLEISYLDKFPEGSAAKQQLLSKLENAYPNDHAVLQYKVDALWSSAGGANECLVTSGKLTADKAKEIVQLCDKILGQIDTRELLEFYGRHKQSTKDDAQETKENDEKKKRVVNALKNKAMAWACVLGDEKEKETAAKELEEALKQLQQWTGTDNDKELQTTLVKVARDRNNKHFGSALKLLQDYLEDAEASADSVKNIQKVWALRREIYKDLGWSLWADYDASWSLIRQPSDFALF